MPAITSIIAGISAAAGVGSTVSSISQGNRAKKQAKQVADKQAADQAKLEAEQAAQDKKVQDERNKTIARDAARSRAISKRAKSRGTILSGDRNAVTPLTPAAPTTDKKTILGI